MNFSPCDIKNTFYQKALYPIYCIKNGPLYGFKIISLLKHLCSTQWFSKDELISYQNDKLKILVSHVYENVPYYRDVMQSKGIKPQDICNIEDLKYFPILTKKIIRDNYPLMMSEDIKKRSIQKASSGGTTGEPFSFFREDNTLTWVQAAYLRGLSWAGYRIGNPLVHFTHDNWPSVLGKLRSKLINTYIYPGFVKEKVIVDYFNEIQQLQPLYMKGSASYLYRVSYIWQKHNFDNLKVLGIFSTSEMLYDYQRKYLENVFKCKVYDFYGCNEVPSLAYECEYNNKHITVERAIIETVDSNSKNVYEIPGQILLTDLNNYAMPFIRYKVGDIGTISNDLCNCGRSLNILKSVEGRSQDFLKTLDGNYVPAIFFPNRFHKLQGISQYQVIQNDLENITLKIVKKVNFSTKELEEMINTIKDVLGLSINVNVEPCENIHITGRGKTRLVISNLPAES